MNGLPAILVQVTGYVIILFAISFWIFTDRLSPVVVGVGTSMLVYDITRRAGARAKTDREAG